MPDPNPLKAAAVIAVGARAFSDDFARRGLTVEAVDWRPPGRGDETIRRLLPRLWQDRFDDANRVALERVQRASPAIVDVTYAADAIPVLEDGRLLHAGPPLDDLAICGPLQGAIVAALLLEKRASSAEDALRDLGDGKVRLSPNHDNGAVGPMAGVIAPSMWGWIVEDLTTGHRSFSPLNEGLGVVMRYGAYGAKVLEHLHWTNAVLGPVLQAAVRACGPIPISPLISQALEMGDECHNRNRAATLLLFRELAEPIANAGSSDKDRDAVYRAVTNNEHFFLNISMAAAKVALDAGHDVPSSTLVTTMSRNGTDFGIRLSGTGDRWFTSLSAVPIGLYFPGYSEEDANPDIGDSAITETYGLGGFALAAAPAIVGFIGGNTSSALATTEEMREICIDESSQFKLPSLNFAGVPQGIDARLVVQSGIAPRITTGIAHKDAGVGQIGAGIVDAPLECFEKAIVGLLAEDL